MNDMDTESTTIGPQAMLLEEILDSEAYTQPDEVHLRTIDSRHNKPKKANRHVIHEGA